MSDTFPGAVTITENNAMPAVTLVTPGATISGVPVYPLASEPGQTWDLQDANGTLAWAQFVAPPGQMAFGLEDAGGVVLLEDGAGVLLLEM